MWYSSLSASEWIVFGCTVLSVLIVIAQAGMAQRFSDQLGTIPDGAPVDSRPALLRKVSWGFVAAYSLQFLLFLAVLGLESDLKRKGYSIVPVIWYLFVVTVQSQIEGAVARKIRGIKARQSQVLKLALKGTVYSVLACALFYGITYGGILGTEDLFKRLGIPEQLLLNLYWLLVPLAIFAGTVVISLISPWIIRQMLPVSPVMEPATRALLENVFKRARLQSPAFWIIELDQYKSYNAMVSGLGVGRGPFQRSLFFSRGLLTHLTPEEFEAIMFHEVSHLSLHHLRKRIVFTLVGFLASMVFLIPLMFVSLSFLSYKHGGLLGMGCYLFAMAFQTFLGRRQVRMQEMEADASAVIVLGASQEVFASALRKLMVLNDQHQGKKGPHSFFDAASAHPTADERIQAVAERLERHRRGAPLFSRKELIADLFQGRAKFFFGPALTVMLLFLMTAVAVGLPRYQLSIAAENGDLDRVKELVAKGYGVDSINPMGLGATPLIYAAEQGHLDVARFLLDHGANTMYRHPMGFTPLWCAVESGNLELVKLMVEHGASWKGKFYQGVPPLMLASMRGFLPVVRYLAEMGEKVSERDHHSFATPLVRAGYFGHLDVVRYLMEKGASGDERDQYGNTALHYAARQGNMDIVKFLIDEKHVDIDEKNLHGSTPLLMASYEGRAEIVRFLIERRAKLDEQDRDGDSALAMARSKRFKEMERDLVAAGAKVGSRQVRRSVASE